MPDRHDHLPRLAEGSYSGRSFVHWIHTIDRRATGWLTPEFNQRFRELLLHAAARYDLAFPIYCQMPDHIHILAVGLSTSSDQRQATKLIRREINRLIAPTFKLQRQAFDHVLTEKEREHDAFETVAHYIAENPVRAELVDASAKASYTYVGGLFPGYPELEFDADDYWKRFWRIYQYRQRG